ncbi:hypothetical protein MNBD_NITROSPINAE03-97 [hydrothermal vent metagenome]|uniref:Uncharacterized protein n=1 Tax=hydrothermal vent metagenome TaxID=652676 RepID=A0A3B1CMG9_9ZZZZ
MTSFLRKNKGVTAVIGSARNDFVFNTMRTLGKDGANVYAVAKQDRLESFREQGFKAYGFSGAISWLNLSVLKSLCQIAPDRIVVVVGDQFIHFNVFRALNIWMKTGLLKKTSVFTSYSFAPGQLEPWDVGRVGPKKQAAPAGKQEGSMNFHLIAAVWGKQYTDLFLNVNLPNLLTPGNLEAISSKADCVLKVYTTSDDAETIANHRFFKEAGCLMKTEIITMDYLFRTRGYSVPTSILLMTQCHRSAVRSASGQNTALIFLSPDTVISEKALERVCNVVYSGKRVIMVVGLSVSKEAFLSEFIKRFHNADGHFPAPSRPIVELALKCLHPMTNSCFINNNRFTSAPSNLFWRVNGEGFVARSLYMHPLMIYPRNSSAVPFGAIDTDYLQSACPDYSDYYVVTDSDDIALFELSDDKKGFDFIQEGRFNLFRFADFIKRKGNDIHYKLLREKILFHQQDLTLKWKDVEKASDKIINKALVLKNFAGITRRFTA